MRIGWKASFCKWRDLIKGMAVYVFIAFFALFRAVCIITEVWKKWIPLPFVLSIIHRNGIFAEWVMFAADLEINLIVHYRFLS